MAHFYGTVQGGRSVASRVGHKNGSLVTTTNGWNLGAYARMEYHEPVADGDEYDSLHVQINTGSASSERVFGRISAKRVDDGCEIRFDKALLTCVPAGMLANHFREANLEPTWLATFASIIARDEHLANVFRAALWIEDRHVAPAAV